MPAQVALSHPLASLLPFFTCMFLHGGLLHLLVNRTLALALLYRGDFRRADERLALVARGEGGRPAAVTWFARVLAARRLGQPQAAREAHEKGQAAQAATAWTDVLTRQETELVRAEAARALETPLPDGF